MSFIECCILLICHYVILICSNHQINKPSGRLNAIPLSKAAFYFRIKSPLVFLWITFCTFVILKFRTNGFFIFFKCHFLSPYLCSPLPYRIVAAHHLRPSSSAFIFYTPFIKVSRAEVLFLRSCAIIWTLSFNFFGTMPLLSCIKKALVLSALSYLILRIRKGHRSDVLY